MQSSRKASKLILYTVLLVSLISSCGGVSEHERNASISSGAASETTTDKIIVKPASTAVLNAYQARAAEFAEALSSQTGLNLMPVRQMFGGAHVLQLPHQMSLQQAEGVTSKISQRLDVEYAEPERIFQSLLVPNESLFHDQWHLREPAVALGGDNLESAWDMTLGDPQLVIALVDSGVLPHADFGQRLLNGYDFISNAFSANDGDGRDADSVDPGDWLTLRDSVSRISSWHGTHVAGILGATGNNLSGVAGINWRSKILPARVLGRSGGTTSDIADAIAWAAGADVPGVPINQNPARVINLSLGVNARCSRTMQNAINAANARSAVVVVAAGNDNSSSSDFEPAGCAGVIAVASVGKSGNRAPYSNTGSNITLSAPGGDLRSDSGILSLGDSGRTVYQKSDTTATKQGTSMAAPQVAGVASLMLSVNPNLSPDQVKSILVASARPFPAGSTCQINQCGAGIVDAAAAVKAAKAALEVAIPTSTITPQSGLWWNDQEDGRGFAIEIQDGKLFFMGFMYDAEGKPTWYSSGPAAMQSAQSYTGTIDTFTGGQALLGDYKSPIQGQSAGQLRIDFSSERTGVITWPGGVVPIKRFEFVPGALSAFGSPTAPQTGFWWNTAEVGLGFTLEVQNGYLVMAGFIYDDMGKPSWYLTTGEMKSANEYSGSWKQYSNGQTLLGQYKTPSILNPHSGTVRVNFTSASIAQITLPSGRVIPIERQGIGLQSPIGVSQPNRVLTAQLLGAWRMSYTMISKFTDDFVFNELRESATLSGVYNIWGGNQFDHIALGGWDPEHGNFSIFVRGISFDDFYTFSMPTDMRLSGCYYLVYRDPTRLSDCYAFEGVKTASNSAIGSQVSADSIANLRQFAELKMYEESLATKSSLPEMQSKTTVPLSQSKSSVLARKPEIDRLIQRIEQSRSNRK